MSIPLTKLLILDQRGSVGKSGVPLKNAAFPNWYNLTENVQTNCKCSYERK